MSPELAIHVLTSALTGGSIGWLIGTVCVLRVRIGALESRLDASRDGTA